MTESVLYEIVETRYPGRTKTKLDFLGTLEEAREKALEEARNNIGSRYSVFPKGGFVAEFQAYYSRTITCPKCGEAIPIE